MIGKPIKIIIVLFIALVDALNPEERLFSKLFDQNRYDKRARPVQNGFQTVNISFTYEFDQLYSVDEKAQTICVLSSVYETWFDYRLYWNPIEYENLITFAVDYDSIWIPDTTLYNTVEMYRPSTEEMQKAVVIAKPNSTTSMISFIYDTRHTVGCRFNMRYFPFDTQNCTFQFGSWSQDQSMIDYILPNNFATTDTFQDNDAWSILSFHMLRRNVVYESGGTSPFTMIYAHLVIKRKSLYYIFNLILPTLVISILSSFAFFASEGTPENRHDKLQIGITTLLSYCVLFLSVSDQIPKGSTSVPLLGVYYVIIMLQNALELVAAIYLSFPNHRQRVIAIFSRMCTSKKRKKEQTRSIESRPNIVASAAVIHADILFRESSVSGAFSKQVSQANLNKLELKSENIDKKPELIFMIASFIFTAVVTAIMFAIGFSA